MKNQAPRKHADSPWSTVPTEVAELLGPHMSDAAEEIVTAITDSVPGYTGLRDAYRQDLQQAIQRWVDLLCDPRTPLNIALEACERIGHMEHREGRALDALQDAVRVAGRIVWRQVVTGCRRANLSQATVGSLAEAVFVSFNRHAAACLQGYAEAESEGVQQGGRRSLLDLILAEPTTPRDAIIQLATATGWQLPDTVAGVALAPRTAEHLPTPALPPDLLTDFDRSDPCLIVPHPATPNRLADLEAALPDWTVAVGPPVTIACAAWSLRWARRTLALSDHPSSFTLATDHLTDLLILQDKRLTRLLVATTLAPLHELTPSRRQRFLETLRIWLETSGNCAETADRLFLHQQTIRYRMRHIEELFGEQLFDPAQRLELELALRAHELLGDGDDLYAQDAPGLAFSRRANGLTTPTKKRHRKGTRRTPPSWRKHPHDNTAS